MNTADDLILVLCEAVMVQWLTQLMYVWFLLKHALVTAGIRDASHENCFCDPQEVSQSEYGHLQALTVEGVRWHLPPLLMTCDLGAETNNISHVCKTQWILNRHTNLNAYVRWCQLNCPRMLYAIVVTNSPPRPSSAHSLVANSSGLLSFSDMSHSNWSAREMLPTCMFSYDQHHNVINKFKKNGKNSVHLLHNDHKISYPTCSYNSIHHNHVTLLTH